jgi:hypothetical protein
MHGVLQEQAQPCSQLSAVAAAVGAGSRNACAQVCVCRQSGRGRDLQMCGKLPVHLGFGALAACLHL